VRSLAVLVISLAFWGQPLQAQAGPTPASAALPDGYPDPQCTKPEVNLVKPEASNSAAVGLYNAKVRKFNKQAAAYDACLHAYIDTANRDVKAIQDKANADLEEITVRANAAMKVINDKIGQAVADGNGVAATLNQENAALERQ
jgi:hypothetical protein